jgi:F420-0:gamma-glutamyl ligase
MPAAPLSPEQRAQADALAQAIRQAIDAEVQALAATLVATAAGHPFGATEFTVRDLAHQIAAKALEQHLAQKKTATSGPA